MSRKELKNFKSPGIDNIPEELIKAVETALIKELHKLINAIWRKKELPKEWKTSIIVPVYKKNGDSYRTVIITAESRYSQRVTKY